MHAIRALLVAFLATLPLLAAAAAPTNDELIELVRAQQARIAALESRLDALESRSEGAERRLAQTETQLRATSEFVADLPAGGAGSAGASWAERTSLGGYGEMHFNRLDGESAASDKDEIDFHRFVLFANHRFSDRLRLYTELEVEHAVSEPGAPGAVELEQAFIEYDLTDRYSVRAGQFLVPVGQLNEVHEPDTFYGVERNDVESILIPSTWWEGGVGMRARYASGLSLDLAMHSGLAIPTSGGDAFAVRAGRGQVAEAVAKDAAFTGRLRYTGIPGLDVGVSLQYQTDASQRSGDGLDEGLLMSTQLDWRRGGFGLRGVWARWDFDGAAVKAAGADRQDGWFLEPSYRFALGNGQDLGLYARYEDISAARVQDRFDQWELGVNWWLHPTVVVKADWRDRSHDRAAARGRDFRGVDLGIGYSF